MKNNISKYPILIFTMSTNTSFARGYSHAGSNSTSLGDFSVFLLILVSAAVIFIINIYVKDTLLGTIFDNLFAFILCISIVYGGACIMWFGFQFVAESVLGGLLILSFGALISVSGLKVLKEVFIS